MNHTGMKNVFDKGYFPEATLSGEDGLLAVGGNLEVPVLLEAYSKGIFPWYSEGSPILWWSPDPRMVLFPDRLKVSGSLGRTIRKGDFEIRMDSCFPEVIRHCSKVVRPGQEDTWITEDMIGAYILLHEEGYAHSVEVFSGRELVGGLYGISLGSAFFGESMFHLRSDASKVALYHLVQFAMRNRFDLIDTQQSTPHLKSLGAEEVPRNRFMDLLQKAMAKKTIKGSWKP
jgi:leucyl/phenylalanyl-tRNA--protein transferase